MTSQDLVSTQPSAPHGVMSEFVHMPAPHRVALHAELVRRLQSLGHLHALPIEMVRAEAQLLLDVYVDALGSDDLGSLRAHTAALVTRTRARGIDTRSVLSTVFVVRDVLARAIQVRYYGDRGMLNGVLDAFEPLANRIATMVAVGFVEERDRMIRELSTPVLLLRERLLILPIVGEVDSARARQITDQLLIGVRTHRAKVVVIDVTGMAMVDAMVATHLVRTVEAARLLGAAVILTGLSPSVAEALVGLEMDLSKIHTVGDLQSGIVEAERMIDRVRPERRHPPTAVS